MAHTSSGQRRAAAMRSNAPKRGLGRKRVKLRHGKGFCLYTSGLNTRSNTNVASSKRYCCNSPGHRANCSKTKAILSNFLFNTTTYYYRFTNTDASLPNNKTSPDPAYDNLHLSSGACRARGDVKGKHQRPKP
ncbi:hypothetical protein NQZ68_013845 [Dissostichus eleginoides]|nr:hypothetical protein NQZ68_013845 [Dissostichus eleginoides]